TEGGKSSYRRRRRRRLASHSASALGGTPARAWYGEFARRAASPLCMAYAASRRFRSGLAPGGTTKFGVCRLKCRVDSAALRDGLGERVLSYAAAAAFFARSTARKQR